MYWHLFLQYMLERLRRRILAAYERSLEQEISDPPQHVAVIQDGNRRYARKEGQAVPHGHRDGAKTTERVLEWCRDVGVDELTLYAFSTENFDRPRDEREQLFDLITEKLYEFADHPDIHEERVRITPIGEIERLPERVRNAAAHAASQTAEYDRFRLNIALAYGGRAELLTATRSIARAVETEELNPDDIDVDEIERRLYDGVVTDVDLIIRTGGDERTSNFLPWHANGNEAAVYFCHPYWPEFSKRDFLRAIRTYQYREQRWRQTRFERAVSILRAFGDQELPRARSIVSMGTDPDSNATGNPDGTSTDPAD